MYRFKFIVLFAVLAALPLTITAQPGQEYVRILIAPDHPDWTYEPGQEAGFEVRILQAGTFLEDQAFTFEVGPEQVSPIEKGEGRLSGGEAALRGYALTQPGFLRCTVEAEVEGKTYSDFVTVAFAPDRFAATTDLPDDFSDFWAAEKAKLADIPLEAEMTLLPERCTDLVNVYHIRVRNIEGFV